MKALAVNTRFILAYARITWAQTLAFRPEVFVKLAGYPVRILVMYYLWQTLLRVNQPASIVFEQILAYYIITFFLTQMFPFIRMARDIGEEIFSGDVAIYLARGVPHWTIWVGRFAVNALVYFLTIGPVAAILLLFTDPIITWQQALWFLILLLIGTILRGLLWYAAGLNAFFLERNMGGIRTLYIVEAFFAGALIPVSLFPEPLRDVVSLLPFQFSMYLPVSVLLGWTGVEEGLTQALVGLAWILAMAWGLRMLWGFGWRHFSGHAI